MAKKKPYRFVLYLLVRFAASIVYILPRAWALATARGLGSVGFYVVDRQRRKTLDHLRLAFGHEKTEPEIQQIAKGVFQNLTMTAAEILQFPKLNERSLDELVDVQEALQVYRKLLAEGRGLISVTAHIGNWELLAGIFGMHGFRGGVIARKIYYEPYNRWIVGLRQSLKVPTIYRDQSSREVLSLLARNEIIGILPDQDIEGLKGVFITFFGRPAYTPVAPVRLAMASGAPILPNFLIRQPGGRYKLVLGEIIRPEVRESRDASVQYYTEKWMASFEQIIRAHPDQWGWMHNRWKTQPMEAGKGAEAFTR